MNTYLSLKDVTNAIFSATSQMASYLHVKYSHKVENCHSVNQVQPRWYSYNYRDILHDSTSLKKEEKDASHI